MAETACGSMECGDVEIVHADLLRFFPDLVTELGGCPGTMLADTGLAPSGANGESLSYRSMVMLLERTADLLSCPDFGMRLAMRQGGGKVFGPLGLVMTNSTTLGEALDYVVKHLHAHSLAARMHWQRDSMRGTLFIGHEISLAGLGNKRQAVEQMLLLAHLNAIEVTGGHARVREVHFRHRPVVPLDVYRRYFRCEVLFDQPEDGVVFSDADLMCRIVDPDAQLCSVARSFIDRRFPPRKPPVHIQARATIQRLIGTQACNNERVAAELCLHPRTLHRRLKAEGRTFQDLKDEVRRDMALYYIQKTDLDLTRVAEKVGYAENSVLTRSCIRWFAAPPSQLRSAGAASSLRHN